MENQIDAKLAATLAKLDAEIAAIDAKLATDLAAIDAEIAAVDAALAAELAQIDAEYTEQITAIETTPVATQLTLDDVIEAEEAAPAPKKSLQDLLAEEIAQFQSDIKTRLDVVAAMRAALIPVEGWDATEQSLKTIAQEIAPRAKLLVEQRGIKSAILILRDRRGAVGKMPMPKNFDECCFEYLATGTVVCRDTCWSIAQRIAAAANTVPNVRANAWRTPDGSKTRVYVTYERKLNGGKNWNGGVGAATHMSLDLDKCAKILNMQGEYVALTTSSREYAGAATRDALRDVEMPALDRAFATAGLNVVTEG